MDKDMKACIGAGIGIVAYGAAKFILRSRRQEKEWLKKQAKLMWTNDMDSETRNFSRRLWTESGKDINAFVWALTSFSTFRNMTGICGDNELTSKEQIKAIKKIVRCLREELDSPEEVTVVD